MNRMLQDAAVVGIASAEWGETPVAFIELKKGATATSEEIIAFVRSQVARGHRRAGRRCDRAGIRLARGVLCDGRAGAGVGGGAVADDTRAAAPRCR